MALRTVCAAALRSGTDLGVNNARTFVKTGIVTILLNYILFTYRVRARASVHAIVITLDQFEADSCYMLSSSVEKDILPQRYSIEKYVNYM